MNPQDSAEFLAQTAQFTSLEKLEAVASQTRRRWPPRWPSARAAPPAGP